MVRCHVCGIREASYFYNNVAYCEECRPKDEDGKVIRHIFNPPPGR